MDLFQFFRLLLLAASGPRAVNRNPCEMSSALFVRGSRVLPFGRNTEIDNFSLNLFPRSAWEQIIKIGELWIKYY
jgi:hypothetical protein